MKKNLHRDEIRAALTGPIWSIYMPFLRDGGIDYAGLRQQIDFIIAAGCKTVLLTAGDSHLIILSDQEITDVTKATIGHCAGRAMVVVAARYYGTPRPSSSRDSPAPRAPTYSWCCRPIGAVHLRPRL